MRCRVTMLPMDMRRFCFSLPLIVSVSVGCGGKSLAPPPTPVTGHITSQQIQLPVEMMVAAPGGASVFASVRDWEGEGRLVRIAHASGTVETVLDVPVGALAIDRDAAYLYYGLKAEPKVRRMPLAGGTDPFEIAFGADPWGGVLTAESIAPSPFNPQILAVSVASSAQSPRHQYIAIYDGATPRPSSTLNACQVEGNLLAFGASPSQLFAFEREVTSFALQRLSVGAAGVTAAQHVLDAGSDFTNRMVYAGGRIYISSGRVFDAALQQVAALAIDEGWEFKAIEVDSPAGRVYAIARNGALAKLRVYRRFDLALIGDFTLDAGYAFFPDQLVSLGGGKLVASDGANFVLLFTVPPIP
jgi:hypothetical protein